VKGSVDVTLESPYGISCGESARAPIESLLLYFQRLSELPHTLGEAITGFLVRPEMLDFSSQRRVVFVEDRPIYSSGQF